MKSWLIEKRYIENSVEVTTPVPIQIDYDASEENVEYVTLDETIWIWVMVWTKLFSP